MSKLSNLRRAACIALLLSGIGIGNCAQPTALAYPPAHRDNIVNDYFGTKVPAPYQWMENLTDPRLAPWVAAENQLTTHYLAGLKLRAAFYAKLTKLWNYPKQTSPLQRGSLLFYRRNSGIQNQSVLYMQRGPTGTPHILLDPNSFSHHGGTALAAYAPSPNGKYVAYALAKGGSDWQTIYVLDVATDKTLPHPVRWVKFSDISWTHDSKGFFYSRYSQPPKGQAISQRLKNQALYYHRINQHQAQDTLIYRRPDLSEWVINGDVSENGRYLFITLAFHTTRNELYVASLGNPNHPKLNAKIRPLFTKDDASYVPIGTEGDSVFIQTDLKAPLGRVAAVDIYHPAPADWRVVVPEQKNALLDSAHMAYGKILVHRMVVDKARLDLYTTGGRLIGPIKLPDQTGTVGGISTRNTKKHIYFGFTSFLRPGEIVRYNVGSGKESVFFRPTVPFNPNHYSVQQIFYQSTGGVRVPMFIVARKGIALDGKNPTILYGYGGFDVTIPPYFSPSIATWLRLGGVYAMPNLRGGGVYGQSWHQAGMLQNKQNVFDDFANAAHWLIDHHYTSSAHLGIMGYSNGGLLTGASVTEHPHLFGAVYIGHGVLDMLRFEKFSGGEYWISEYGTASEAKDFKWLAAYSPLQNLKKGVCYPPTIITTSTDDDRVVPSNAYKFAAQMQRDQGCANPILLHTATATSHIYMPVHKHLRHDADNWGFMGHALGMKAP